MEPKYIAVLFLIIVIPLSAFLGINLLIQLYQIKNPVYQNTTITIENTSNINTYIDGGHSYLIIDNNNQPYWITLYNDKPQNFNSYHITYHVVDKTKKYIDTMVDVNTYQVLT